MKLLKNVFFQLVCIKVLTIFDKKSIEKLQAIPLYDDTVYWGKCRPAIGEH
jgi:hypothetical protein